MIEGQVKDITRCKLREKGGGRCDDLGDIQTRLGTLGHDERSVDGRDGDAKIIVGLRSSGDGSIVMSPRFEDGETIGGDIKVVENYAGFRKLATDAPDGNRVIVYDGKEVNTKKVVFMLPHRRRE